MPELPEVENVKLSLTSQGFIGQEISKVELLRGDLRVPILSFSVGRDDEGLGGLN